MKINPLLFWKHQDCSSMKTLALCNFNVSAITAMVERAFSAHKLHLTSLRTSLKDNTNGGLYLRQPQNCWRLLSNWKDYSKRILKNKTIFFSFVFSIIKNFLLGESFQKNLKFVWEKKKFMKQF